MIKKEGGKVNDHYTTKIWILGAIKRFIVSTRMGHLIICIRIPKTFTFSVNLRPIEFEGKVAKNAYFSQKTFIFDVSLHIDISYNIKNEMLSVYFFTISIFVPVLVSHNIS